MDKAKIYLTDTSLSKLGFTKKANMYFIDDFSLELINGHTWMIHKKGDKWGKQVRNLQDIENYTGLLF